jgi:hypothetical protein
MPRTALVGIAILIVAAAASEPASSQTTPAPGAKQVPLFEVDPEFFSLPAGLVMGNGSSVAVDQHDNVWVLGRPRLVEGATGEVAPPLMQFDATGKYIQGWGGKRQGVCDWPQREHGMFVDYKGHVWFSSTTRTGKTPDGSLLSDDFINKWTADGTCVMQIGRPNASKGPRDTTSVHGASDMFVYAKSNEVFVADDGNLRVIVFDADTGAFKRMWGAFGDPPPAEGLVVDEGSGSDLPAHRAVPVTTGPGPRLFSLPHGLEVSNDGLVYVTDRNNSRVQVFTLDGKFVTQAFFNRTLPATSGSVVGIAFSSDPEQRFLYLCDYGNSHIIVAERKTLDVLYQFGQPSARPGDVQRPHQLAVDSKGNLYVAEVAPGNRVQRFVFKGLGWTE